MCNAMVGLCVTFLTVTSETYFSDHTAVWIVATDYFYLIELSQ